jgi:MoaA/NifB/PqqE/SkfB family radical SAM enzyme
MIGDTMLRARLYSVAIEISGACNLRCAYCHKADAVLETDPAANASMTEATLDEVYRYCKSAGVKRVTLSVGGESTFIPDWHVKAARFLDDPEISTHMVSNFARVLNDDDLAALSKLDELQVSFDSSDRDMVRKLRSNADLRTITYNVVRLRQAANERGHCPFILVNCTVCRDNIGHIGKLAGFVRALGVDQLLLTEVVSITPQTPPPAMLLSTLGDEEVILLCRNIIAAENVLAGSGTALRLQERLRARVADLIDQLRAGQVPSGAARYFHRRMITSACTMPWQSPMIDALGNVIACCDPPGISSMVGNVAKEGAAAVIDSPAMQAIRASIIDGRPIVKCEACAFARPIDFAQFRGELRSWLAA